ncbi:MAG TPA: hypothetical protein VK572_01980, partial [Burkholderiales bacterium]|nr:hypothetical protein [Burkholderiales bacterium]
MAFNIQKLRAAASTESKKLSDASASLAMAASHHQQLRAQGATAAKLARSVASIKAATAAVSKLRTNNDRVADHLIPATPDQVLGALELTVPLVLLPVRLETRVAQQPAGGWSLCVRVFPDAIHIDAHEPELTALEQEAGLAFWQSAGGGDRASAWLGLVQSLGAQRAAWVAEATRTDPETGTPIGQGTLAATGFTRPTWTEALPDQFVFCVLSDGANLPPVSGARIRPPVATGPDPRLTPDADDGTDAGMRWMTDFDAAVAQGLGARVSLGASAPKLIQRVTVLGVRATLAPADGDALLEKLLHAHRYADGLEVLRVGTASNSSNLGTSGFSGSRLSQAEATPLDAGYSIQADSDGARVASALGVPANCFAGAVGADLSGEADAQAMFVALWPGTLGYFLRQMLPVSVSQEDASLLRAHALNWVRGRGPFAPLRVGRNPYGLLPVSSLAHFVPDATDTHAAGFVTVLRSMMAAWTDATDGVPKVGRGDPKDSSQTLAQILALSPLSVAIDARRIYPAGMVDILSQLSGMSTEERKTVGSVGQQLVQGAVGALGTLKNGDGLLDILGGETRQRLKIPRVQQAPLSDVDPLVDDYLTWLRNSTPQQIAAAEERFGSPLLYLLARYSLLHQYERAASTAPNLPPSIDRSSFFDRDVIVDIMGVAKPTLPLDVLETATTPVNPQAGVTLTLGQDIHNIANRLAAAIPMGGSFTNPLLGDTARPGQQPRILARMLSGPAIGKTPANTGNAPAGGGQTTDPGTSEVAQVLAALDHLAGMPSATLDRLLRETLDLASHRLDAWITSLPTMRLSRMRAATPRGAHVGAYGFVENIIPAAKGNLVQPPGSPQGTEKAFDAPNQGFLHAPSMGHAATAAVLRSGHVAHGDGAAFAVSLESSRVRRALYVLEGVRQGQPLGALLGYQLERALMDRGAPSAIAKLRDAAPLRTSASQPASGVAFEQVAPRDVVDGQRIARGEYVGPNFTAQEQAAVNASVAELRDTLDATGDLLLAEGVHQIVAGTPARAAAVVQAAAGMAPPPDRFEVISTPGTGTGLTQRVLLVSDQTSTVWLGATSQTPRVLADPLLEGWVASRLGDPAEYSALVVFSKAGAPLAPRLEIFVNQLGIGALDAVAMSRPAAAGQLCELERRVLDWAMDPAHRPAEVPADATAAIAGRSEHAKATAKSPLSDLIVAADAIADLFRVVRVPSPHELDPSVALDADGFDIGELAKRLSSVVDAAEAIRAQLAKLLENVKDEDVDLASLLAQLRTTSFVVAAALPEAADASLATARATLVPQGRGMLVELARRLDQAEDRIRNRSLGSATASAVDERREIAQLVVDNAPPMSPQLDATLLASLGTLAASPPSFGVASTADQNSLIRAFLARARHVRRGVDRLDESEKLAVALGGKPATLRVAQSGTAPGDMWVALPKAPVPGGV